jgi:hypothetical protein
VEARASTLNPVAYAGGQPLGMVPDLIVDDIWPEDERLWVPLAEGVWSRPLHFNVTHGQWTHLTRITKAGIVTCHRHAGPVFGFVLKGHWHYLEHDWVAREGGFVFEPPGETHTLVVPEDCTEMATIFQVSGALVYVTEDGTAVGYEDVFTRMEKTRAHYRSNGIGEDYVDSLIR